MPSRKIVAIFIISVALVASVILAFGKEKAAQIVKGGSISTGPATEYSGKLPKNTSWQSDISSLSLRPTDLSLSATSSTQNLTDKVSESLIGNYLSLRESGNLNDTSAASLINQAVNFTESDQNAPLSYTTADIVVSSDNSGKTVRRYGTELGNAFKVNKPAEAKNEIAIFSEMLQKQDRTRVSELKEIALIYRHIEESALHIQVPSSYAQIHLDLLNNLDKIARSVDLMSTIFDDPLQAMRGVGNYQTGIIGFGSALSKIRIKILKDDKIVYKQGESGYYLYYGI